MHRCNKQNKKLTTNKIIFISLANRYKWDTLISTLYQSNSFFCEKSVNWNWSCTFTGRAMHIPCYVFNIPYSVLRDKCWCHCWLAHWSYKQSENPIGKSNWTAKIKLLKQPNILDLEIVVYKTNKLLCDSTNMMCISSAHSAHTVCGLWL